MSHPAPHCAVLTQRTLAVSELAVKLQTVLDATGDDAGTHFDRTHRKSCVDVLSLSRQIRLVSVRPLCPYRTPHSARVGW
eukprot:72157-Rhodomonas_salina.1